MLSICSELIYEENSWFWWRKIQWSNMKALIRWLNPVDTETGDVIHEHSLGWGSSALTSSFQKDLEAQSLSTGHIHLISVLASIKSKYKV